MSDKAQLQALSLIQLHVYTFSTQQHLQSFSQSHKLGCRRPDLAQKRVQWNRTPFCRRPPLWCDQHIFDYSSRVMGVKRNPETDLWLNKATWRPTYFCKFKTSGALLVRRLQWSREPTCWMTQLFLCANVQQWEPTAIKLHHTAEGTMKILRNDMTITTAFYSRLTRMKRKLAFIAAIHYS